MSSGSDLVQNIQRAVAATNEYQENIKTPLVNLGVSTAVIPSLTVVFWPLDVIKNHVLGGKGAAEGIKKKYNWKGIGFGMLGAGVLSLDISNRYIKQHGQDYSFSKRALIGLAPLSLVPLGAMFESLKINSQLSQVTMKQCYRNIIQSAGYRGLLRGIVPYASIFALTYSTLILPQQYYQKPPKARDNSMFTEPEPVYLNPAIILSYFLLCTPLDIIKTRAMIGEKISLKSFKISPQQLAGSFVIRTFYLVTFGAMADMISSVLEGVVYKERIDRYTEKKKDNLFAKDDEFDDFLPLDTANLDSNDILTKVFIRDG